MEVIDAYHVIKSSVQERNLDRSFGRRARSGFAVQTLGHNKGKVLMNVIILETNTNKVRVSE